MEKAIKIHPIFAGTSIVLLVAIMYVSLLPNEELPKVNLIQADKLVHISMYFILSLFLFKGFIGKKQGKVVAIVCLLSFLYGFIVEVLQYSLPTGRMFDIFDIFANGIGAIFAYFIVTKYF
ncbi:MAG: VanZ family protein [Chitinophagales bacterium]|nr:VanZ family protein [Chitinophagales bacterium]